MATNTTTLLGLPAELQIHIAKDLEDEGLRAIHQVCRTLTANTAEVFEQIFFRERRHLYTTHSLQALRDISAIPRFARRIESIELRVMEVSTWESHLSHIASRDASKAATDAAREWHVTNCREVESFGHQHLQVIFKNLNTLGVGRKLKLTGNRSTEEGGRGRVARFQSITKALPAVHGISDLLSHIHPWAVEEDLMPGHLEPAIKAITTALNWSDHALEMMDLGHMSVFRFSFSKYDKLFSSIKWASLKALKLGIQNEYDLDFSQCIQSATSLISLSLDSPHEGNLRWLREDVALHQLKYISILGIESRYTDFVRSIACQAKSLEHLCLSGVTLLSRFRGSRGLWRNFFRLVSKCLRLSSLKIEYLEEQTPWTSVFLPDGLESCYHISRADKSRPIDFMKDQLEEIVSGGLYIEEDRCDEDFYYGDPDHTELAHVSGIPGMIEGWEDWMAWENM